MKLSSKPQRLSLNKELNSERFLQTAFTLVSSTDTLEFNQFNIRASLGLWEEASQPRFAEVRLGYRTVTAQRGIPCCEDAVEKLCDRCLGRLNGLNQTCGKTV